MSHTLCRSIAVLLSSSFAACGASATPQARDAGAAGSEAAGAAGGVALSTAGASGRRAASGAGGKASAAQGGRGAAAVGGQGAAAAGSGALANPAPGSKLFAGANFWNIDWEGSGDYFSSGVSWSSVQNPWRPELLSELAPYRVLRFMDWNLINEADNPQADWDTRKHKTDKQDEPVALEWQIDLCNRAKKDYWLNIPHAASADYLQKLATLVQTQLDPSLRVYVEWSNEVWNGGFMQRGYAQEQATKLGLDSGDDKAALYLVYQSVRAFEAFEAVFGKGSPRLVKVLAGQAGYAGPCRAHMAALKDSKINPNGTRPDVYAVAPYFAGKSLDELTAAIPTTAAGVEENYQCAHAENLPLIAYEGGQDSYAAGDGCTKLQHDPSMRAIYMKFLDAMSAAKLTGPFTQYTHTGQCWGLMEKTGDTLANSPKYQGLVDWLAAQL